MRVAAVTGASGHVGANLTRLLLDKGWSVRALVLDGAASLDGLDIDRISGDVADIDTLRPLVDGADVVFHLAAVISTLGDPGGLVSRVNVLGPRNIARAAREARVHRLVHMSSIHAFDMTDVDRVVDEDGPRAGARHGAYDRSKQAGEQALREEIDLGLDAVILNPTGVIGRCDFEPSRTGRFLRAGSRGRLPAIVRGGFTWVDVRDVASAALAAVDRGRTGANYILGSEWKNIRDLTAVAAAWGDVPPPRIAIPMPLARFASFFNDLYGRVFGVEPMFTTEAMGALRSTKTICCDRARTELGFDPYPIDDAVRDACAWWAARAEASA
jgi:dihydroflavonol-4-reductase